MAALRSRIARIQTLPAEIPAIASQVSDRIRKIIAGNIAAGVSPDGKKWPETEDGHQPLSNAMQAVDVRAIGPVVVVSVDGIENRHHIGNVKGGKKREIIPSRRIPDPMVRALDEVTQERFRNHMAAS